MAKSLMMGALDAGVDPEAPGELDRFLAAYSARLSESPDFLSPGMPAGKPNVARPARENPFKHLGRNQLIRVRYIDGSLREGKFKRLEADLQAGKCTLEE